MHSSLRKKFFAQLYRGKITNSIGKETPKKLRIMVNKIQKLFRSVSSKNPSWKSSERNNSGKPRKNLLKSKLILARSRMKKLNKK
jgi:hypothetical protein